MSRGWMGERHRLPSPDVRKIFCVSHREQAAGVNHVVRRLVRAFGKKIRRETTRTRGRVGVPGISQRPLTSAARVSTWIPWAGSRLS